MTRIGELEMFSESLGTTHLPLTTKRGRWKHEPQAWGARYQDTGMQFLKLYFPNISFSGAARRWSKGVVVPRKSRQFNRAYLKAAYQIAQCSLGCDLNLVYELTIFQIPRVSDLFGNQQLTSTGRRWILCPTQNTGWIIQSEQINCYVQKLVIVNKG